MLDVTPQEWTLLAAIALAAVVVGLSYRRRKPTADDNGAARYLPAPRRPPLLALIGCGAPCCFWLVATLVMGLLGFADSLADGRGLNAASRNAVGVGLLYGFGCAFYGCPFAILGGYFAARGGPKHKPPPPVRIDVGPL